MKIGILFDLDGTLLDTLQDLTDSVNYALAQFDCPPVTPMDVRRFLGNGAKQLIALSLPKENAPDVDEVLAVYKKYYKDHCQIKTAPYGGIPEALEALKGKYPIAVVSNKQDAAVKPLCAEHFPGVYALGEVAGFPRKPQPDMVHKAMKELGVDGCIYVGDSEVDIATANNSGVPCLSVLWGFRDRGEIEEAGGCHFCEHTEQLVEKLEELINGQ